MVNAEVLRQNNINKSKENASKWVGKSKVMNCGLMATITYYNKYQDIGVEFENGESVEHRTLQAFKEGVIKPLSLRDKAIDTANKKVYDPEDHIKSKLEGNTYYTAEGEEIEIVSAKSTTEIYIKTWGKEIRKCALYDLENGRLHSQKCVYDHLGNKYKNNKEKAAHYGVEYKTYTYRIRNGWSEEEALTKKSQNVQPLCVVDHKGNKYKNNQERAKAYGISASTVRGRLESGWDLEKALTTPSERREEKVDYLGQEFKSFTDMCRYWGWDDITLVIRRLDKGWSLERALTTPSQTGKKPVVYEGVKYSSKTKLYNELGISSSTVKKVMKLEGLSFTDAVDKARTLVIDNSVEAFGRQWSSCTELAKHYGLNRRTLSDRININGQDPEEAVKEALECKLDRGRIKSDRFEKIKVLYVDNIDSYYLCFDIESKQEEVLSLKELKKITIL